MSDVEMQENCSNAVNLHFKVFIAEAETKALESFSPSGATFENAHGRRKEKNKNI